jgi:hypothetical protein
MKRKRRSTRRSRTTHVSDNHSPNAKIIAPRWQHPVPGIDFDIYEKKSAKKPGGWERECKYPKYLGYMTGRYAVPKLGDPKFLAAMKDAIAQAKRGGEEGSKRKISKALTLAGIITSQNNLVALLSEPFYVKLDVFSAKDQAAALAMLAGRKWNAPAKEHQRALWNGILVCGHCHNPGGTETRIYRAPSSNQDAFYRCLGGPLGDRVCPHPYVNETDLDACLEKALGKRWPRANGDREATADKLNNIVDRAVLYVDRREKIGAEKILRRHLVVFFEDGKTAPLQIDEEDISPAIKYRVVGTVRKAGRELTTREIAAELSDLQYGTVYTAAERAKREGLLKKSATGKGKGICVKYGLAPPRPKNVEPTLAKGKLRATPPALAKIAAARKARGPASRAVAGKAGRNGSAPSTAPASPFPGLKVDEKRRTILGANEKEVDLFKSPLWWHIFITHFKAGGSPIDKETLRNGYPGEWGARYAATSRLNKLLRKVDHEITKDLLRERPPPTVG